MSETTTKLAYRVAEVAALTGVGVRTLWKEIAAGRLRAVKLGGPKNTRVTATDLEEYIESHRGKVGAA